VTKRISAIDEEKVARVVAERERNIKAQIAAEDEGGEYIGDIYVIGARPKKVTTRVDRTLERSLIADLSQAEWAEFGRRCEEKAKERWRNGKGLEKWMWGGWR
jgi:hypothetical protein